MEKPTLTIVSRKGNSIIVFTGENDFRSWVRNAIKNDEVLQFNQKNSQPLKNLLGANYPVLVNYGGFNENVAKFNNNVKNKFPSYDEIAGAKQVVKEQTLDRLDQTLPDTSMAEDIQALTELENTYKSRAKKC